MIAITDDIWAESETTITTTATEDTDNVVWLYGKKVVVKTKKEAAIEMIKSQPFF